MWGEGGYTFSYFFFSLVILRLYTKIICPSMTKTGQKVCGVQLTSCLLIIYLSNLLPLQVSVLAS